MIQHIHHGPASPKKLPGALLVSGVAGCNIVPLQTGKDRQRIEEVQGGTEEEGPNRRKKKPPLSTHRTAWLGRE